MKIKLISFMLISAIVLTMIPFKNIVASELPNSTNEESEEFTPSGIAYSDIKKEIDGYIEERKEGLASVSVGVFNGQKDIFTGYYGYTDIDNKISANEESVYEWGSCSKLFTWVCVMQLYEKGLINLEADIREYLPEGFLTKIKFDKPITMLNLMNHNAGWQEIAYDIEVSDRKDIKSLKEALQYSEPTQIYEPGKVTAYSNWGAALAAYIVENVSGLDYADYVHENILKPLSMEHTSVNADFSDNEWVQKKRDALNCYSITSEGRVDYGKAISYILLYPVGSATGTLSDFMIFAKQLVANDDDECKLFQSIDTLKKMEEASDYYGDSDIARNYHGLWTMQFTDDVMGHAGNTKGCSSMLVFEPISGLGMVIMTNECAESAFTYGIPLLIYGDYSNNERVTQATITNKLNLSGALLSLRTIKKGFAKIFSTTVFMPVNKSDDSRTFKIVDGSVLKQLTDHEVLYDDGNGKTSLYYITTNKDGSYKIQGYTSDYEKQGWVYFGLRFGSVIYPLILMLILVVISIISMIVWLVRRCKGKLRITDKWCRRIYVLQLILGIAFGLLMYLSYWADEIVYTPLAITIRGLLVILCSIAFVTLGGYNMVRTIRIKMNHKEQGKGTNKYLLISIAELLLVFVVVYWQMFLYGVV